VNKRDTTDSTIIAGGSSVFAETLEGLGFSAERAECAVRGVQFRRLLAEEVQLRNKLQTKILEPARERLAKIENKPVLDPTDLKERQDLIALFPDAEAEQHRALSDAIDLALTKYWADTIDTALTMATIACVMRRDGQTRLERSRVHPSADFR
jgi:hypothetical protein